mmetsp:Transcript_6875/g.11395  ORF Transcript_6875/g.11395 Transcript_6875/m.11395 type:complete len:339 (+) Transcript_6875:165-1181(+)|eukprot:CAMPEP_0119025042 /NCGR_PEP_ID=MMETSP1176-20130426/33035_1 /TAXON_ID=265551 /ORGANISM="Synedropsis recta cf, Strain CCMP1620" /LENGTH=338 /DNA_ID=CAMNT_0006980487 /DNA_START=156 /DNA_END=1172 /DNA_ORIENTATION=-
MQLFTATIAIASVLLALKVDGQSTTGDQGSALYFTLGAVGGGCIGLKDNGRLILRTCSPNGDDANLWTIDDGNRFRNKADMAMCMQAGGGDSSESDGIITVQMTPCGTSDLQRFDLTEFIGDGSYFGPIKPVGDLDLCMVHRGPNANVEHDPILLKDCAALDEDRAQGWMAEFPDDEEEYSDAFTFEAPGGGCIGLKDGKTHRGNRLKLRTCSLDDDSLLWVMDSDSRFRSMANVTMCLQAGKRNTVPDGTTTMRIVPCGVSDLQKFDVSGVVPAGEGMAGPIMPADYPGLCMVHKGPIADINKDSIILKKCKILGAGDRDLGWMINFVAAFVGNDNV